MSMPPLAVPNPPVAASLQAATRVPVRLATSVVEANYCKASQRRTLAVFAAMLAESGDLWPTPARPPHSPEGLSGE